MPPRPVVPPRQSRPVSAIYVGKAASPSLHDLAQQSPHFASYPSLVNLPDLPEPPRSPSPSSSIGSPRSGLPSPPATNSTGSGSTGDPATIRERPLSLHSNGSASTSNSSHYTSETPKNRSVDGSESRSSSRLGHARDEVVDQEDAHDYDDYDDDNKDNDHESNADGDDTARFDRRVVLASNDNDKSSSENMIALQRAHNLAKRTRMAIDKLRTLGSPSPGRSTPGTPSRNSPAPSQHSRLSQPPTIYHEDVGRSGSETEREENLSQNDTRSSYSHSSSSVVTHQSTSSHAHTSSAISSSNRSSTPPPSHNSPYHRLRHLSAPESPQKVRGSPAGSASVSSGSHSASSHSPSRRRRNRSSMASMSQVHLTDFEEEDEEEIKAGTTRGYNQDRTVNERDAITQSALAAVTNARRSPLDSRRRSALPREFRSDLADESPTNGRHTSAGAYASRDTLDHDERRDTWRRDEPVTPSRHATMGVGRSATLRDTRRTGGPSPRWSSDDFRSATRAPGTLREQRYTPAAISTDNLVTPREGRRQSLRGGSAESALVWSPGGRLLGEGLRAAGLSPRKGGEGAPQSAARDTYQDQEIRQPDWGVGTSSRRVDDHHQADMVPRASTSMSNYKYLDREDVEAAMARGRMSLNPRGHKSSYSLAPARDRDDSLTRRTRESLTGRRERDSLPPERAVSSLSHYTPQRSPAHTQTFAPSATPAHLQERSVPSPFGTRRFTQQATASGSQSQSHSEHTRLMLDSLAVFESQLSKLPPSLGASGNSAAAGVGHFPSDVARSAQGVVNAAERLATLLKLSSARAMDAQVAAEVDTPSDRSQQEIADIWSRVAADYRDGSRTADELVRVLTAMLLGVGRIIRELNITGGSDMGSPAVSGRHLADDSVDMVESPVAQVVNGTGRESRASRQSWDSGPRDREREREETFRRLEGTGQRSESVLARASPATFQKLRDHHARERESTETPPPAAVTPARRPTTSDRPSVPATFRRLFTPREQRERTLDRDIGREVQAEASGSADRKGKLPALDSQETVQQRYESPTPASRTRITASPLDRQRTLTPLAIPKPLPTLPSETLSRRSGEKSAGTPTSLEKAASTRSSSRRPLTAKGDRPSFPSITTPSNATTAITAHTVSNSPKTAAANVTAFPLSRNPSSNGSHAQVTFSRPNLPPVSATLSDLQQQHMAIERKRTISTSSNTEPSTSHVPSSIMRAQSGSETERDIHSRTLGVRRAPRASLDVQPEVDEQGVLVNGSKRVSATVHAADRSAATTILHQTTGAKRERRRTVTEIWGRE